MYQLRNRGVLKKIQLFIVFKHFVFTAPGELYIFWSRLADCQSLKPRLHTQPQLDLSYPLPSGYGLTARLWGCATGQGQSIQRRACLYNEKSLPKPVKKPAKIPFIMQ